MSRIALTLILSLVATVAGAQALSDPTRRFDTALTAAASEGGWVLQSTRIASNQRLAVINGQTVREGERVGNARVLRIDNGQVQLIEDGQRRTLSMFVAIGKTPTSNPGSHE